LPPPSDGARTRILFVTHSMVLGGAPRSLDLLVRGLDHDRFECVIACIHPTPEVMEFHLRSGVQVIAAPGIGEFPHTTGGWLRFWNPRHLIALTRSILRYRSSVAATLRLIEEVRPDIVHLNSVILAAAAEASRRSRTPLVWHIRESVVRGHLGLRRRWLRRKVQTLPDAAIFLSQDDMDRLGPRSPNWHVVPNWTPFDVGNPDRDGARQRLAIPQEARVILFMGGYNRMKGTDVLLRAMPLVRRDVPEATCLIVAVEPPSPRAAARVARAVLPFFGIRSDIQECERLLSAGGPVITLPFLSDTSDIFAAADVLAFPAREPHFARPVVEAFAHHLPVVASDLGPMREITEEGVLGILVTPGRPDELADGLIRALSGDESVAAMTEQAFPAGLRRFSPEAGRVAIERIYAEVLA